MSGRAISGDDRLLAHVQLLSTEPSSGPPQLRLAERVEPALMALLVRALQANQAPSRGARRI